MNQALSLTALERAAEAQFPEGDFGGIQFKDGFQQLLHSLQQEAQLEPIGLFAASARLVASLKRRRQLSALIDSDPSIKSLTIEKPIFILGFPRTGTTLLHNLFASDPDNRSIRLWEMREPFITGEDKISKAIKETQSLVEAGYKLSPDLRDIHPLNAEWPDECSWLFRNSFASMVLGFSHYIPSYVDWLLEKDMSEEYAYFKLQLQSILSLRPGSPLVLKDPCHLWHIPQLLEAFPNAKIVQLHRQPAQVAGSFASLCRTLQTAGASPQSMQDTGQYSLKILHAGVDRMMAARDANKTNAFIDLAYSDLINDPTGTMRKLYESLDMDYTEGSHQGIQSWLDQGKKHTGKHHYTLQDFGLETSQVNDVFKEYMQRFSALL